MRTWDISDEEREHFMATGHRWRPLEVSDRQACAGCGRRMRPAFLEDGKCRSCMRDEHRRQDYVENIRDYMRRERKAKK